MDFLNEIISVSRDLWMKGWAERNAGNISMKLCRDDLRKLDKINRDAPWVGLQKKASGFGGELLIISGTGKYLKNIAKDPQSNLGIIELDSRGENYRILWGFADGGQPSCELPAHIDVHTIKKESVKNSGSTIIHTHPVNLITLTYMLKLDTNRLTGLLWRMHAESVAVFPEGIEFVPWMVAGSNELADATRNAFIKRNAVLWQYHGAFGWGRNPDEALGLIDTAEKAAEIYIKASAAGPVNPGLSAGQLRIIAKRFGVVPDEEIIRFVDNNYRATGIELPNL